jgi:hypothetical protein
VNQMLDFTFGTFDAQTRHRVCEFAWFGLIYCEPSNQTSLIENRIGQLVRTDLNSPTQATGVDPRLRTQKLDLVARFAAISTASGQMPDESLFNDVLDALDQMIETTEFADSPGFGSQTHAKYEFRLRTYTKIATYVWLDSEITVVKGQPTIMPELVRAEFSKEEMAIARRIVNSLSP